MKLYNSDCLEVMQSIKDNSIDLILCDLPYGCYLIAWNRKQDRETMKEMKKLMFSKEKEEPYFPGTKNCEVYHNSENREKRIYPKI